MTEEIKVQDLSTKLWKAHRKNQSVVEYDAEMDTLFLCFVPDGEGPIVTHYIDEFVAVLYQHANREVVGVSIEGFVGSFAQHFNAAKPWRLSRSGTLLPGLREMVIGFEEIIVDAQVKEPGEVEPPAAAPKLKAMPQPKQRTPELNIRKKADVLPQYDYEFVN